MAEENEIIIDGVNVAECLAYKNKHCIDKTSIMFCDVNLCSNYPYCYYKQLQRLKQENEELKARRIKSLGFICDCEEREKYKQALEEIREICKMDCGDCPYNQDCDCNYSECEEAKIDDILDKINEVLK